MNSTPLRIGLLALRIGFWGGMTYGTIMPAYQVAQGLEEINQFIQSARQDLEARTDKYYAHRFEGILRYADGKEKAGEQKAIRQFRRNIENVLEVDCNTIDGTKYEMPVMKLGLKGIYELRMKCRTGELVIPFPRENVNFGRSE